MPRPENVNHTFRHKAPLDSETFQFIEFGDIEEDENTREEKLMPHDEPKQWYEEILGI